MGPRRDPADVVSGIVLPPNGSRKALACFFRLAALPGSGKREADGAAR